MGTIETLVQRIDQPTKRALIWLQGELRKEFPCFPQECCLESSMRGEELKLGLTMVYGLFVGADGLGYNHHWLTDGRNIWDITAYQFEGVDHEILVCKKDSPYAQEKYIEGEFVMY